MSDAWRRIDLEGGGLQSANLRLARLLKRRRVAYALLCVFPLGLHRDYLGDRAAAWAYRAGTGLLAVVAAYDMTAAMAGVAAMSLAALVDLFRMESRIVRVNKALRMSVYLGGKTP